jgi:hypothetical protein
VPPFCVGAPCDEPLCPWLESCVYWRPPGCPWPKLPRACPCPPNRVVRGAGCESCWLPVVVWPLAWSLVPCPLPV